MTVFLELATPHLSGTGLSRGADGDSVKPVAQQLGVPKAPGLAGQNEEDGLERILGKVTIPKVITTNAQNHRSMPCNQCGEGVLGRCIATFGEPLQ